MIRVELRVHTTDVEREYHGHEAMVLLDNIELASPMVLRGLAHQMEAVAAQLRSQAVAAEKSVLR